MTQKVTCKDKKGDDSKPICKEKWEVDKTQVTRKHIGNNGKKIPTPYLKKIRPLMNAC
jgi:hypothetical protein